MYDENSPANPPEHADKINEFLNNKMYGFMLTIARDGENPPRSIYHFESAVDAVDAYNRYTNFGFAKEYLTVSLYEANKKIHTKILRRPPAGECSYVKQNYIEMAKLMKSIKNGLTEIQYKDIVGGIALIFSQDNIRFNSSRFFEDCECEEVIE